MKFITVNIFFFCFIRIDYDVSNGHCIFDSPFINICYSLVSPIFRNYNYTNFGFFYN